MAFKIKASKSFKDYEYNSVVKIVEQQRFKTKKEAEKYNRNLDIYGKVVKA